MSLRFWTTLQNRKQAVFVKDSKIQRAIPDHPPKTIARRAAVVAEYKGKLALVRQASFELWSRTTLECFTSFPHNLIYTPHDLVQVGDDILICSSGLEMFFLMDIEGNVKWEWWGHENGLGAKNRFFTRSDWEIFQTTSDLCAPPIEKAAHYNSIWMSAKDKFITAALRKQKVIELTIGQQGYNLIANIEEEGCHSPFLHGKNRILIYGTDKGIQVGGRRVMKQYAWVKYIRPFEDGFVFAHETGVATADAKWKLKENIRLPMPYKFAFLERKK